MIERLRYTEIEISSPFSTRDWRASELHPDADFDSVAEHAILHCAAHNTVLATRVGTLIVATIYLQLIQNRYMFRSFTVLQCSHQHCVQPVASDVEIVGYL